MWDRPLSMHDVLLSKFLRQPKRQGRLLRKIINSQLSCIMTRKPSKWKKQFRNKLEASENYTSRSKVNIKVFAVSTKKYHLEARYNLSQ